MGEFLFIRLSVLFLKCLFPQSRSNVIQYYPTHVWLMYPWFVSCLGDIQIGMVDKKGALEVEVIRARGLVGKPGSKALPGECGYTLWWWFLRHLKTHHSRLNSICGCFFSSPLCKGVSTGERGLHSQKENKSSTENTGPSLPAAAAVWREPRWKGFTGILSSLMLLFTSFRSLSHGHLISLNRSSTFINSFVVKVDKYIVMADKLNKLKGFLFFLHKIIYFTKCI